MKQLGRIACIFFISLSIMICLLSVRLGIGGFENPGPGFLPILVSSVLFFLSLAILIKDFVRPDETVHKELLIVRKNFLKPIALLTGLLGYTFLLDILGYLITTFLIMVVMFFIFDPDPRKCWKYSVMGAAISSLSFLVFYKWLQLELPIGIFRVTF